MIGHGHHLSAWLALASGAVVLFSRKGTRWHKRWGWTYFISMVLMNLTALFIYRLSGSFGVFHYFALGSLGTLVAALLPVRTRRTKANWVKAHANLMAWSYVGLVAAAASEVTTRLPVVESTIRQIAEKFGWSGADFGLVVGFTSCVIAMSGGVLIARYLPRSLAHFAIRGTKHLP